MWLYIGIGVLVIIGIIILGKVISGVEKIFKVVLFPIYGLIAVIKFIFKK